MSLLMEALRKAEEAKSKAAQEGTENFDSGEDTPPVDAAPAENADEEITSEESNQADLPTSPPEVINPEPDEAEVLAAHAEQEEPAAEDTFAVEPDPAVASPPPTLSLEPRPEEEETGADGSSVEIPLVEPEVPPAVAEDTAESTISDLLDEDGDEDLAMMASSYFARTRKPGGLGFEDDDFDDLDDPAENSTANTAGADSIEELSTEPESTPEYRQEDSPQARETPEPPERPTASGLTPEQESRSSAGALFLAKQESQRRQRRRFISIAAVLLVIPVAGIAWWLYSSLASSSGMEFNVNVDSSVANRGFLGGDNLMNDTPAPETTNVQAGITGQLANVPATAEAPAQAVNEPSSAAPEQSAGQAVQSEEQVALPALPSNVAAVQAPETQPAQAPAPTVQQPAQATQISTTTAPAAPAGSQPRAANGGLSFVRTDAEPQINPDLRAAYESYQSGDYANAGRLYQQVMVVEPNSRDAMLGLASVYLKQNNIPMSQNLYARLLELNPRDPIARAGLLETSMRDDPLRQETELKSLITAYPTVPPLSFALGNLYASQNRWNEAQNAYFNALLKAKAATVGSVSPDYAFNLAVSLERLNQLRAALDYYREAADFSRSAVPGFDPALLEQRMDYLEQRLP